MKWTKIKRDETKGMLGNYYYEQVCGNFRLTVEPYLDNRYRIQLTHNTRTLNKKTITAADGMTAQREAEELMDTWVEQYVKVGTKYLAELVLEKPYTVEEMMQKMDKDCYVDGYVAVPLSSVISTDFEEFLDLLAVKLTNSELLMDINYKAVGAMNSECGDTDIIIKVRGDVSEVIPNMEEDED